MQLSQSVTYSLQALLQLAESGEGVLITRGKLAATGHMPERFLLEILHDLVKRGILRSTRGGGGGFALANTPENISLLQVVEAVDGPLPAGLPANSHLPTELNGWLRTSLVAICESTRLRLSQITLACLLREMVKPRLENNEGIPLPSNTDFQPAERAIG